MYIIREEIGIKEYRIGAKRLNLEVCERFYSVRKYMWNLFNKIRSFANAKDYKRTYKGYEYLYISDVVLLEIFPRI